MIDIQMGFIMITKCFGSPGFGSPVVIHLVSTGNLEARVCVRKWGELWRLLAVFSSKEESKTGLASASELIPTPFAQGVPAHKDTLSLFLRVPAGLLHLSVFFLLL